MEKKRSKCFRYFSRFFAYFFLGAPLGIIVGMSSSPVIAIILSSVIGVIAGLFAVIKRRKNFMISNLRVIGLTGLVWGILGGGYLGLRILNSPPSASSLTTLYNVLTEATIPSYKSNEKLIDAVVRRNLFSDTKRDSSTRIRDSIQLRQRISDGMYIEYVLDSMRIRKAVAAGVFEYRYHNSIIPEMALVSGKEKNERQKDVRTIPSISGNSEVDDRSPFQFELGFKAYREELLYWIDLMNEQRTLNDINTFVNSCPHKHLRDIISSCNGDIDLIHNRLELFRDSLIDVQ
jgi:hypothetical protein